MKYVKMLGLLAVVASSLMAFAGIASADEATSPKGSTYSGSISAQSEGHVVLDNPIAKIECPSTVSGDIESLDKAGENVFGEFNSLTFNNCTDSWHVTVAFAGNFSVNATGGFDGEASSSGATVEATRFGITCRYSTSGTKIGTLTGGSPATLHINAKIPFHSGSVFCGTGSTAWTGNYEVTSPTSLYIDPT
jgi:hypothetical protein